MELRSITSLDASAVAALHIEGIGTGFISSLGIDFVTALYEAIAKSKYGFGLVAREKDKVIGFVAFTTDINALYKSVILKKGPRFVFLLAGKMLSIRSVKKAFETLLYPSRTKKMKLPSAELLSIVVANEARGKGLGFELIQKGFMECASRGIDKVKVLVGAENKLANKLYLKSGFELVGQIDSHRVASNVYIAKTYAR
jgi:ribosomal protein S18 acetylase RimI-like enzyme